MFIFQALCAVALSALWWLVAGAPPRGPQRGPRAPWHAPGLSPGRDAHHAPHHRALRGTEPDRPAGAPLAEVPLLCDAVAALVDSGMSVEEALEAAGDREGPVPALGAVAARLRWGSGWAQAWASAPGCAALEAPLRLSSRTGAPAAALLRDAAAEARRRAAREQEAQAAAMTVRLVLPLGLCALPAFVCLGIVPVALALLPWL